MKNETNEEIEMKNETVQAAPAPRPMCSHNASKKQLACKQPAEYRVNIPDKNRYYCAAHSKNWRVVPIVEGLEMKTAAETKVMAAQVYHVKDIESQGYSLLGKISWGEVAIDFPKNYELVADLKIEAEATAVPYGVLEEAFKLTNNIHESWVENVEGAVLRDPIAYGRPGRRSTSVGDVTVVAGIVYICAPMGWKEVVSADQKMVRGAL